MRHRRLQHAVTMQHQVEFDVFDVKVEKKDKRSSKRRGGGGGPRDIEPVRTRPGELVAPALRLRRKRRTNIAARKRIDPNPARRTLWHYGAQQRPATASAACGKAAPPPSSSPEQGQGHGAAAAAARRPRWNASTEVVGVREFELSHDPYVSDNRATNQAAKTMPLAESGIGFCHEAEWRQVVSDHVAQTDGKHCTARQRRKLWDTIETSSVGCGMTASQIW